jgi:hypothetical protein
MRRLGLYSSEEWPIYRPTSRAYLRTMVLELSTIGTRFDTTHLDGPRHCEPFTITLTNTDVVWVHNVALSLIDQDGAQLFVGTGVHAPETVRYDILPCRPASIASIAARTAARCEERSPSRPERRSGRSSGQIRVGRYRPRHRGRIADPA